MTDSSSSVKTVEEISHIDNVPFEDRNTKHSDIYDEMMEIMYKEM